jgi:hypothetical protein
MRLCVLDAACMSHRLLQAHDAISHCRRCCLPLLQAVYSQAPVARDLLANGLAIRDYYLPLQSIRGAACCGTTFLLLDAHGRLLAADLSQPPAATPLQQHNQQQGQQQQQQQQQGTPGQQQGCAVLAERLVPVPVLTSLGPLQQVASAGSQLALLTLSGALYYMEQGGSSSLAGARSSTGGGAAGAGGAGSTGGSSREELQSQLDHMLAQLKLQEGGDAGLLACWVLQ